MIPLEIRKGQKGEPFATRTLFGWSFNGPARPNIVSHKVISNFITTSYVKAGMTQCWNSQDEGINEDGLSWSQEDKRVIDLWNRECKLLDGHYQIPIPWRDEKAIVPNNFCVAMSRLKSLNRSLEKKKLTGRYNEEIQKLFENKYAEMIPNEEVQQQGKIWYLPHHAVITDKKPDKVRIVFDCSSKYKGESLNDKIMQGPDLNNRLIHVLLRFRLHQFAVMGDIESMYHQVKITTGDKDALRFLWFNEDGNVIHCRMTSHLFGGIWCPSSSIYALQRTVKDNNCSDPLVSDTVKRYFYVDDCLRSMKSKEEAERVIQGTKEILKKGGFK